jgi:hypothetical protein
MVPDAKPTEWVEFVLGAEELEVYCTAVGLPATGRPALRLQSSFRGSDPRTSLPTAARTCRRGPLARTVLLRSFHHKLKRASTTMTAIRRMLNTSAGKLFGLQLDAPGCA